MNLFRSHPSPELSAAHLDDGRLSAAVREAVQLLGDAARRLALRRGDVETLARWSAMDDALRPARMTEGQSKHPVSLAVSKDPRIASWAYDHAVAVDVERCRRNGSARPHAALKRLPETTAYLKLDRAAAHAEANLGPVDWRRATALRRLDLCIDLREFCFCTEPSMEPQRAVRLYLVCRWALQARAAHIRVPRARRPSWGGSHVPPSWVQDDAAWFHVMVERAEGRALLPIGMSDFVALFVAGDAS